MAKEPAKQSGYKGTSREAYQAGAASGSAGGGGSTGKTEQGYTNVMKKNILSAEQGIRRNRDESAFVYDSSGRLVGTAQGKGNSVSLASVNIPKDAIITHNHPLSIGKTGIRSIGNSFSRADILTAVANNAKEIRAVTPTYTFSVKRPANGWGDITKIDAAIKRANKAVQKEGQAYVNKARSWKSGDTRAERATVVHTHAVMKKLSKQFGWNYTKKKG